ncbi:hypothetical protein TWF718_010035 [Orbilia javanica]|uniref:Uncharacterized protein n=1 Tax=Orbilia javanica TaxID=47235 RepID=A0AAN8MWH9_9PEZI
MSAMMRGILRRREYPGTLSCLRGLNSAISRAHHGSLGNTESQSSRYKSTFAVGNPYEIQSLSNSNNPIAGGETLKDMKKDDQESGEQ